MIILVGCEESQAVTIAFRERGHEAYSCDIQECSGWYPEWHIQGDVFKAIRNVKPDILIAHPPCTYLVTCAEWAFKEPPHHQKTKRETLVGAARVAARESALLFVKRLLNSGVDKICIENPVGVIGTRIFWHTDGRFEVFPRKTIGCIKSQIIQPWQFGENASKKTCLFKVGLPDLIPTTIALPRIVNGKKRYANQTDSGQNNLPPSADRAKLRSKTYPGIAAAMANQWG